MIGSTTAVEARLPVPEAGCYHRGKVPAVPVEQEFGSVSGLTLPGAVTQLPEGCGKDAD